MSTPSMTTTSMSTTSIKSANDNPRVASVNDNPPADPPMQSPAPVLAAVAALAILLLTGLMATDFIWTAQHPVATAHAAAPHTPAG